MLDTQKRSVPKGIQEPRWKGVTVLAVDDHLPNLLVLDALLSELGINVITVSSGFDAIELISKQQTKNIKTAKTEKQSLSKKTQISKAQTRDDVNKTAAGALPFEDATTEEKSSAQHKNSIDLIFMDIQMPRMSGHEAARQIRNIEAADSHIPIIALTAHGLADERDKLIASGIDDYVGKPISQPQLLQVLQKWLGRTTSSLPLTVVNEAPSKINSEQSSDLRALESPTIAAYSDATMPTYPMIKRSEPNSDNTAKMRSRQKITRPLSLKKIRDDYLRDSQPREDYRREPLRETQPRYENLRYQEQEQAPLEMHSFQRVDSIKDEISEQAAQNPPEQKITDLNAGAFDSSDILNWQDALTRSANKPDLAAKLIIMMLDTINDEKQALTKAWETRNRSMLGQIAHRILGGSRYTGVPQLRQASQDLEDKCLLNIQHTTPAQFAMLEPYYDALLLALNNLQTLDLSSYPHLNYHRLSENDMTWKMI